MRSTKWLVAVLAIFVLPAAGCGEDDGSSTPTTAAPVVEEPAGSGFSVAFLFDLFVDDGGWNSTHNRAVEEVRAAFPGLEVQVLEEISPGTQTSNVAEDLAADGVDMVISTAFAQPDILEIAPDYPDTIFLTWAGWETTENVGHTMLPPRTAGISTG